MLATTSGLSNYLAIFSYIDRARQGGAREKITNSKHILEGNELGIISQYLLSNHKMKDEVNGKSKFHKFTI